MSFAAMRCELANGNAVEKYNNGKQGKISFIQSSKEKKNDKDFLKQQLQTNGIVLTKLKVSNLSPNVFEQKPSGFITFYLEQQPTLNNIKNGTFAINSLKPVANYNTISDKNSDLKNTTHPASNGFVQGNNDIHLIEYGDYRSYNTAENSNDNFEHNDSTRNAVKELILPVMLSGFGNMGAGIILDSAQNWKVFQQIPQLIVLVPALLGLKGNVEMTLSSRLGTCANLGELSDKKKRKSIVLGNISLAQCQASAVGLIAPFIAISFSYFQLEQPAVKSESENIELTWLKTLLILASSVMTSGLADLMLSSFMCFIVIISVTKLKINADNIATPIAASVGDLATMSLFATTSKFLFSYYQKYEWLPVLPIVIWVFIILFTGTIARRNDHTSKLIYTGWTTLIISMMIQNTSGTVMENFFRKFNKMAAFQPVINGFGGNLVAVQSSRIATYLHKTCKKKQLPDTDPHWFVSPWKVLFGKNKHGKLALILILMAAPLQLPFVFLLRYITASAIITPAFLITYYICCTIQVTFILYVGYMFVHLLWKWGFNPDNNSIPILTALADLVGSLLFALGFLFLSSIQDPNAFNKDISSEMVNQTITSNLTKSSFFSVANIFFNQNNTNNLINSFNKTVFSNETISI